MTGFRLALLAHLVLAGAAPLWAQDTIPVRRDTTAVKAAVREQALQKLRSLESASRPGRPAADSTAADRAVADTAGAPGGGTAGVPGVPGAERVGAEAPDPAGAAGAGGTGGAAVTPGGGSGPGGGNGPTGAPPGDTAGGGNGSSAARRPDSGVILASDSVVAMLRALEGYVVTEYRAANARFDADSGRLELIGKPELRRQGQMMRADSLLRYDQNVSVVCGYGSPVLEGAGSKPVTSEQVCYDVDKKLGVALGARTEFTQGATWYVHGDELYTAGSDRVYGAGAEFTSCDLDVPHYHFSARSLKVVHDNVMVARDVTLNFGDVPVFWLPFIVQSLKPDRRSGLLPPSIGFQNVLRTHSGYRRSIRDIGFFWAINDYLGAMAKLDWESGNYTQLTGTLQFNWARQFLRGYFDIGRIWQAGGSTSFLVNGTSSWQPDERTSVSLTANYTASEIVRRSTYDPRDLTQSMASNFGFNHRFDWGSFNLSANRTEQVSSGQVNWVLPSASLSISPITLFPAMGEAKWYNNATWTGSMSFESRRMEAGEPTYERPVRDNAALNGSAQSSLSIGNLRVSQTLTFQEQVQAARPALSSDPGDGATETKTLPALPRQVGQKLSWTTSVGYMQRLFGTTSLTPSIMISGAQVMPDTLGGERIDEPTRVNFQASLNTDIYGFWPGFGPFSRIRHHIKPVLTYSYSPVPAVTQRQREVFGKSYDNLGETNTLQLTLTQTFEAKYADADTAAEAAVDTTASLDGEPRRLPQARKITLLSINTGVPLKYDFVRAQEGEHWQDGFTTEQLTHSIRSDLIKGLTLSIGHDLFEVTRPVQNDTLDIRPKSRFAPRLRSVSANFSLDSDSWIFRALGLGGAREEAPATEPAAADSAAMGDLPVGGGSVLGRTMGNSGRNTMGAGAVGSWRANFRYSLERPPAFAAGMKSTQRLQGDIHFQPTEKWQVSWSTSYDFTEHQFSDHILTLTRDLHRWQANFDFYKAPNGNFLFQFRVNLIDNPDIKLDYDQRSNSLRDPRR